MYSFLRRGNAVKCLARLCHMATRAAPGVRIAELQGGDKHNAIPREGRAALLVPDQSCDAVRSALESEAAGLREAYGALEDKMHVSIDAPSVRPAGWMFCADV